MKYSYIFTPEEACELLKIGINVAHGIDVDKITFHVSEVHSILGDQPMGFHHVSSVEAFKHD